MANGIQLNTSTAFAGLGTLSFTAVTAGPYTCSFVSAIPFALQGGGATSSSATGSSLQVVINQDTGGGPAAKLTVSSPSAYQKSMGGTVRLSLAAGDVVTVVLTSSAAIDNTLNAIKTTVNLYQGE